MGGEGERGHAGGKAPADRERPDWIIMIGLGWLCFSRTLPRFKPILLAGTKRGNCENHQPGKKNGQTRVDRLVRRQIAPGNCQ
jgi:hypothetical protein